VLLPSTVWAQGAGRSSAVKKKSASQAPAQSPATVAETWGVDTAHSTLGFNLRLFAGRSEGQFRQWSGTITMPPGKWDDAAVNIVIQAASVETDDADRDKHLRTPDFFDVEKYPTLTFKSTKITHTGDSISVTGNLTIKNVTKSVTLKGTYLADKSDPASRLSFHVSTVINRLDYGVNYDNILVRDGIVLGEDVTIDIMLTAVKQ